MNFYALNVAPINGNETHLGRGTSGVVVSANQGAAFAGAAKLGRGTAGTAVTLSGAGRLIIDANANAVSMAVTATGTAPLTRLGTGSASTSVSATGRGYARIPLSGELALTEFTMAGDGTVIPSAGGRILMEMAASGSAKTAVTGRGEAGIALTAQGKIRTTKPRYGRGYEIVSVSGSGSARLIARGYGSASMALTAAGQARTPTTYYGSGTVSIDLQASSIDRSYRTIQGEGRAIALALTAQHAMPRSLPVSIALLAAPKSRTMRASTEDRRMNARRLG